MEHHKQQEVFDKTSFFWLTDHGFLQIHKKDLTILPFGKKYFPPPFLGEAQKIFKKFHSQTFIIT